MTRLPCDHPILDELGIRVARCDRHSHPRAGIATWVWCARALPANLCPCGVADRFRVAIEFASTNWTLTADVVIGTPQVTRCAALRFATRIRDLPGCALVAVAAGQNCTVLRTCTEHVLVPDTRACGLCVYPWLVAGHNLTDLAESLHVPLGR
jgi:hypothetical protein